MHSPSSDTRFAEAQKLLNYGFSNFTNISFGHQGDTVGTVTVNKGVKNVINAVLQEDASLFIQKSKSSQVVQNITFNEKINAPINQGDVIGTATYSLDDQVKKLNLINMTTNLYDTWFNLVR